MGVGELLRVLAEERRERVSSHAGPNRWAARYGSDAELLDELAGYLDRLEGVRLERLSGVAQVGLRNRANMEALVGLLGLLRSRAGAGV